MQPDWRNEQMVTVDLRPITADNWKTCIALTLAASQQHFVADNLYSIAEAQFYPSAKARALYTANDQMVGFVLYGLEVATQRQKVFRLMIDQHQQGRGYGRAAMRAVIADVLATSDATALWISYREQNIVARHLYHTLGFHEHTIEETGRIIACLDLMPMKTLTITKRRAF
jgi:diamine N-acetyltransferase